MSAVTFNPSTTGFSIGLGLIASSMYWRSNARPRRRSHRLCAVRRPVRRRAALACVTGFRQCG